MDTIFYVSTCPKCGAHTSMETTGHSNSHGEDNYQITIVTARCDECEWTDSRTFDTRDITEVVA